MTAVLVGMIFIVLGVWGLLHWFQDFIFALKGLVPVTLIVSGLIALIVGLASLTSRAPHGKEKN